MSKRNKMIYWIATLWLALGMASTGIVQLLHHPKEVENMLHLGYPVYFLTLMGSLKLLGVLAVLSPRYPVLKEWAYAGFCFAMTGAIFSRVASGDSIQDIWPALLLLVLTGLSWYFRPVDRRSLTPVI